uniref:AlNc14C231G9298 protein n=1 Tax=Albugo laibachii Nc14 TaxID=890382 RepID=F0WSF7_9STRA|nr:AlNc14C231G9298 [Albugo laibachii Nc14]|eukprot:CCA24278.1 AlNc14C231G9298 [Albugo laibachii Nc14]
MSQALPRKCNLVAFISLFLDQANYSLPNSLSMEKTKAIFWCQYLDIMPEIMCDYESDRLKNNVDLNDNHVHIRDNDMSEFSASRVANVVVVKWDTENVEENAAFKDCILCLTRKRKVVLISLTKRYVWMVDSGSFPYCEMCNGKVTLGPQFPYNQYLRQIPVQDAMKMTDTSEEERKRPTPDELELDDASDEDPTRSNQGSDEFRRRSKRKKPFVNDVIS